MTEPATTDARSPMPARVLVIDDEPQIRKLLDIALRAQGHGVELADSGQAGLDALAVKGADLVVLDMGLPDRDGLDVLRELRQWSQVPVIVLTVRSGEAEKVAALDAGANDYVTKPFGVQELMARIRVLLRSQAAQGDAAPVFDDGRLRIDLARREVSLGGEAVALSRKEYALLAFLVRHAGRVV
ncbi:MAG TPA: response regulator transcription factor, partial [Rhodanobacter sp.]|nr:response regulator transcription factor [Rhodanobacter sp.]